MQLSPMAKIQGKMLASQIKRKYKGINSEFNYLHLLIIDKYSVTVTSPDMLTLFLVTLTPLVIMSMPYGSCMPSLVGGWDI